MHYEKKTVGMYLYNDADGKTLPVALKWDDGSIYKIDKIISIKNKPPENVGGIVTKQYTVKIAGKFKIKYYEKYKNIWFLEIRVD